MNMRPIGLALAATLALTACGQKADEPRLSVIPAVALPVLVKTDVGALVDTRVTTPAFRAEGGAIRLQDSDPAAHLTGLWRFDLTEPGNAYTVRLVARRNGSPSTLVRLEFLSDRSLGIADCNLDTNTGSFATRGAVLNPQDVVKLGEETVEVVCSAVAPEGASLVDVVIFPAVGAAVDAYSEQGTGFVDILSVELTTGPAPPTAPETSSQTGETLPQ